MEVSELVRLADWFGREVPSVRNAYADLQSVLQHNASQSDKRPLEIELTKLIASLENVKFDELSLQQLETLQRLDVRAFLGADGVAFVNATIRTSNYDPATAAVQVQSVITNLDNATGALEAYRNSIRQLKLLDQETEEIPSHIVIRVGFQNDASIENVADWKNSARDWYDIIRGLALAAKESPEETKILGTANGSIILVLSATLQVTTMLALIAKTIAMAAKEIIGIGIQRENLRREKLLNSVIAAELDKLENQKRSEGVATVMDELKKHLHTSALGDAKNALEASVKKLLAFNEKGGNVDFVAPPDEVDASLEDADEAATDPSRALLAEVRRIIHEYQGERESLRFLTDQSGLANDNDPD